MNLGLLVLRVAVGGIVAPHGAQKLLGWFGGGGLSGTSAGFARGWRAPLAMALLAGGTELFGGLALVVGFLTPFAALGFLVVMLNAIATVHWKNGFFNGKGGFEFNLLIIGAALALCGTSAGRFSVDHALRWTDNLAGRWWLVGAAGAAIVIAATTQALFRKPVAAEPAATAST